MFNSTKAVKQIFYINIIMFILTSFFPILFAYLAMYDMDSKLFMPHQLITHQFLHGGFLHILFNMLVLISFGPSVEDVYGYRKFIFFYLLCGIAGAMLHSFMLNSNDIPLVGASGSIWGIMMLFTILYPNQKMYLFFIPYGIKGKYLITALFVYELLTALISGPDGVAHYGHVGGALMGCVLYLCNRVKKIPNLKTFRR
jgi:membrane associated rhomboid family serine protease